MKTVPFYIDSICKLVTFGNDQPIDLQNSEYWAQTKDEVKLICELGDDVRVYRVGMIPRSTRSVDDNGTF